MAEINAERRDPSVWPWIVGLIVLALLIWGVLEVFDRGEPRVVEDPPVGAAPPPQSVPLAHSSPASGNPSPA